MPATGTDGSQPALITAISDPRSIATYTILGRYESASSALYSVRMSGWATSLEQDVTPYLHHLTGTLPGRRFM